MEATPTTQKWSFGGVLLGPAMRTITRDPVGILVVPLLLQAPLMAFSAVEGARWGSVMEENYSDPFSSILWNADAGEGAIWTLLAWFVIAALLSCLASALVLRRTVRALHSTGTSLETDFRHAFARTPRYFVGSILVFLISFFGLFLLIIPGFVAFFFLFFAPILTVTEDLGIIESLGESARRVRAHFGIWLGTAVVLVIAFTFVGFLYAAIGILAAGWSGDGGMPVGVSVATNLSGTVIGSFLAVIFATLANFMGSAGRAVAAGPEPSPQGDPETRSRTASLFE